MEEVDERMVTVEGQIPKLGSAINDICGMGLKKPKNMLW